MRPSHEAPLLLDENYVAAPQVLVMERGTAKPASHGPGCAVAVHPPFTVGTRLLNTSLERLI
jgi:hypothetical protein